MFIWSTENRNGKYLLRYWSHNTFVSGLSEEGRKKIWCILAWHFLKPPFISLFLLIPPKTTLTSKCFDCKDLQTRNTIPWFSHLRLQKSHPDHLSCFLSMCSPFKVNEYCSCSANLEIWINLHFSVLVHNVVSTVQSIFIIHFQLSKGSHNICPTF